jgi:hypothetical protein
MFLSKPLTTFSCFCILLLVLILVKSQQGFQIGVGFHSMPFNASEYRIDVYNESIYSKTPFGFSLNTDYTINDKFRIKSGLEYRFQNISFNNITDFRAEFFSIPVIFNYNFPKINKYGLTLGLDLGISVDKLSSYLQSFDYKTFNGEEVTQLDIVMQTNSVAPLQAFEFNNLSGRLGINIKKDIGKRGHLNFYIHGVFPVGNPDELRLNFDRQFSIPPNVSLRVVYEETLNITPKGFQFGMYYTFGTLTFK